MENNKLNKIYRFLYILKFTIKAIIVFLLIIFLIGLIGLRYGK